MNSLNKFLKNLKRTDLLITPRLETWLVGHPEFPEPTDAELMLIKRLLGARGSRAGTFTGSQAGTCERQQMFRFIGVPELKRVDPDLIKRFADGTFRHIRWQLMLARAIPGLEVEVRVDAKKNRFRGALDGVHKHERWGLELKGTSNFKKVMEDGVFDPHVMQATRYWLATDEDPSFPELAKWSFIYENKMSQEHREIVVERDYKTERWVQAELDRLNKRVDNHELGPILSECRHASGTFYKQCPFSDRCLRTDTWDQAVKLSSASSAPDRQEAAARGTRRTQQPAPARSNMARRPGHQSQ